MVSFIILNYNRKDEVLFTLDNVYKTNKNVSFEIVLIDQNSTDGSQEAIREGFPQTKLYCSQSNLGVAGGRNKGVELSNGEILVFLDDDAHFNTVNAVNKIDLIFKQDSKIGIVGFKVVDKNYKIRDWQYNYFSKKHSNRAFYTQQFVGCGHAIRASLFNKINGYSSKLFFWGEEIEFCLKTYRDTSYNIIYHPGIEVTHRVSELSRFHWKTDRTFYKSRNRFALILNYFSKKSIFTYLFYFYFFIGYLFQSLKNLSFKYFIKGFIASFKLDIKSEKLSKEQMNLYSLCYLKQYFGRPSFYKSNLVSEFENSQIK